MFHNLLQLVPLPLFPFLHPETGCSSRAEKCKYGKRQIRDVLRSGPSVAGHLGIGVIFSMPSLDEHTAQEETQAERQQGGREQEGLGINCFYVVFY